MKQFKFLFLALAALVGALCLPAGAGASIPAGNTGWFWSNPRPQGNTLDRVVVSGSRVWAGGATGTLIESDDGGSSWSAVRTGLLDDVRTIFPVSPNSVIFAGSCALRRTDDGGATVRRLAWGSSDDSCSAQIQSVAFAAPLIGHLLLTNGDVYVTGDGGESWKKQSVAPGSAAGGGSDAVRDIQFTSSSVGVLSSGNRIFQTVDAGQSWTPVKTAATGSGPFSFDFVSSSVGYAVGDHTEVLKTTDGGGTWNAVPSDNVPQFWALTGIDCIDEAHCLATTAGNGQLLRTTDGGASWSVVSAAGVQLNSVAFTGATRAVAVGANGLVIVSDDSGATWTPVNQSAAGPYKGLRADSAKAVLAFGEQGALARSLDLGASWQSISTGRGTEVIDAAASGKRIFALNAGGALEHTDDASSWTAVPTGSLRPSAIFPWTAKRIALIGPKGVRISNRAGAGSEPAAGAVKKLRLSSADAAGKATFVYGPKAIAMTRDKGRTWKRIGLPKGAAAILKLDMVDAKNGFLLDRNAELFRTFWGGRRWTRIETTGANVAASMAFGSMTRGYLTDNAGRVLASDDANGSGTWARQYPFFDALAKSDSAIVAPSRRAAVMLVKGTNRIFATTTGGRIGVASKLTISPSAPRVSSGTIVRVTGRLAPATGTERVSVLARVVGAKGGTRWVPQERTVSATGTFTTSWRITATTEFIARWSGDAAHDGDAAPLKIVKLRK